MSADASDDHAANQSIPTFTADIDLEKDFASEAALKQYCTDCAKSNSFKIVVRTSGRAGGTLLCSLWGSATDGRPAGCNCLFKLSYGPRQGRWLFRKDSSILTHQNHDILSSSRTPGFHVDCEAEFTEEMMERVRQLILLDVPRGKIERNLKTDFNIKTINTVTFKSVMEKARINVGLQPHSDEVARLVDMIQNEIQEEAHYRIGHDDDFRGNKIFYMSETMIQDFKKIGQVLVMDCTCKTNRFGWALFVTIGINQHLKTTLLAIALQKSEDIVSFDWVLDHMRSAVGKEAWLKVQMVMTDGDPALLHSLSTRIPHAKHHRCRWHINHNIRTIVYQKF